MTSSTTLLAAILKLLIIFLFAGWVALWLLKPTQIWTRKWKQIEDSANNTIFGYYGKNEESQLQLLIPCVILSFFSSM